MALSSLSSPSGALIGAGLTAAIPSFSALPAIAASSWAHYQQQQLLMEQQQQEQQRQQQQHRLRHSRRDERAAHPAAVEDAVLACKHAAARRRRRVNSVDYTRALNGFGFGAHPIPGAVKTASLYCRSGTFMEILNDELADQNVRSGRTRRKRHVQGTKHDNSPFSILQFMSVAVGLVSIRGQESQRYLCMNRGGRLYGATHDEYTSKLHECIFMEEMEENYYNLYSSCAYSTQREQNKTRRWYVALNRNGRPRRGDRARKRRRSSHFMVVRFDNQAALAVNGGTHGYTVAHASADGVVKLYGPRTTSGRLNNFDVDGYAVSHSRFGAGDRVGAWRDRTQWRRHEVAHGQLPVDEHVKPLVTYTNRNNRTTTFAAAYNRYTNSYDKSYRRRRPPPLSVILETSLRKRNMYQPFPKKGGRKDHRKKREQRRRERQRRREKRRMERRKRRTNEHASGFSG